MNNLWVKGVIQENADRYKSKWAKELNQNFSIVGSEGICIINQEIISVIDSIIGNVNKRLNWSKMTVKEMLDFVVWIVESEERDEIKDAIRTDFVNYLWNMYCVDLDICVSDIQK